MTIQYSGMRVTKVIVAWEEWNGKGIPKMYVELQGKTYSISNQALIMTVEAQLSSYLKFTRIMHEGTTISIALKGD